MTDLRATAALREAVAAALQAVANRLPDGCARVEVEESLSKAEGAWRCVLRPAGSGEGCSEVILEIPDAAEVIYVGFGDDSRLEVTASGGGWRDDRFESHLDQVAAIAAAVATGRLSETTWVRGARS